MSLFFSRKVKHRIREGLHHETERNLMLVNDLVVDPSARPKLYPATYDDARVSQYKTHRDICVAPASLWYTKQYPKEKWVEFIRQLPADLYVYFLGSGTDRGLCDNIIKTSGHPNCLNLAGKLKFLETAALQRDAVMNFVNDSAPMHLASSVNAPVTAIFCSTVPDFGFGPLSDDAVIVQTHEALECRPCGLHGKTECPLGHFNCALQISAQELLERI